MPAEATSWGRRWCAGYRPWSFAGQRQAGLALGECVCVARGGSTPLGGLQAEGGPGPEGFS